MSLLIVPFDRTSKAFTLYCVDLTLISACIYAFYTHIITTGGLVASQKCALQRIAGCLAAPADNTSSLNRTACRHSSQRFNC
jgi:hypothetical protein